jgi:hypothetical protein
MTKYVALFGLFFASLLMTVLKLTGAIDWGWIWILLPIWGWALWVVCTLIAIVSMTWVMLGSIKREIKKFEKENGDL